MEDETTMVQEDQTRNYRSSKKQKQKKIPQRGLGVAQLEKIIEEQQHIRDGNVILPSPNSNSSSSSTISSYLPLPPINNFNHSNQPSSTIPLHSGSLAEFRSTPLSLQQQIDAKIPNMPKFEIDFKKDNSGVEQRMPFLPSLPFDSNTIWPIPSWFQRIPQYHQPSSAMVNISTGTPSIPVSHLAIEPPSNQNFSSSGALAPVKPPEKAVGMKRPYPFSLDYPLAPAFNYKLPSFADFADRSTNARTLRESEIGYDAPNPTSREVPPCSASKSEPISKKRNKWVKDFDGHFLTLATPSPISHLPSHLNSSTSLAFQKQECSESDSPFYQENIEDQFSTPSAYRLFNQQKQTLYNFLLPPAKETLNVKTTARIENCYEVEEESVDLNLKL